MRNQSIYTEDFMNDMNLLDHELKEIEDLYTEIKTHFDEVKGLKVKGSLSFLEKQTSNLIGLKKHKLDIIREKAYIKKSIFELDIKNTKTDIDSNNDKLSKQLFDLITKQDIKPNFDNDKTVILNEDNQEDIDKNLEDRIINAGIDIDDIYVDNRIDITDTKNEKEYIDEDKEFIPDDENEVVADSHGKRYIIDKNNVIIKTFDNELDVMKMYVKNGITMVELSDGHSYELIEKE